MPHPQIPGAGASPRLAAVDVNAGFEGFGNAQAGLEESEIAERIAAPRHKSGYAYPGFAAVKTEFIPDARQMVMVEVIGDEFFAMPKLVLEVLALYFDLFHVARGYCPAAAWKPGPALCSTKAGPERSSTSNNPLEVLKDIRIRPFSSCTFSCARAGWAPAAHRTSPRTQLRRRQALRLLAGCPVVKLTMGETPSPDSPRLMKTPRRVTLSPKGARAVKSTLPSPPWGRGAGG